MALKSIQKPGKVSSLTVSPDEENALSLQYGDLSQAWTLTVMSGKPFDFVNFLSLSQKVQIKKKKNKLLPSGSTLTKIRGEQKPTQQPLSAVKV